MKNLLAVDIGSSFGSPFGTGKGISDLVSLILSAAFAIAGILIIFFMLMAGYYIIAGAGSNNPESAKKGKAAAEAAVVGFVIVFVAYWIIRVIEAITGSHFITASGF